MADAASFQPLLPEEAALSPLLDPAADLQAAALRLAGQASPSLTAALRPRLRAMNSYYTNRIEGQHTRPADIDRALLGEFDADAALARKQRLAIVHMQAEEELEAEYAGADPRSLFAPGVIVRIHEALYSRLSEDDRRTDEGDVVEPGRLRARDVTVGRHLAPPAADVALLLDAWAGGYARVSGRERLLIAVACSHQRLAWIHPFRDGNGRVARLHSHLLLHAMGLSTGLWSPMRGLARFHDEYYARLANADLPRRNDLDGRGSLSQEELVAFARYFVSRCADQVAFLEERLDLGRLKDGLAALLAHLAAHPWQVGSEKSVVKAESLEALHYCAVAGPLERSRFVALTGLGDRTGRRVLASLLDFGILAADTPKAPVTFALPLAALRFVLPGLWPEADVD